MIPNPMCLLWGHSWTEYRVCLICAVCGKRVSK